MRENFSQSVLWIMSEATDTSRGIKQNIYNAWCGLQNSPAGDVKDISMATASQIYQAEYWQPNCDFIPSGIDYLHFASSVIMGQIRAVMLLQRALRIGVDGHFGVVTMYQVSRPPNAGQAWETPAQYIRSIEETTTPFYESMFKQDPETLIRWLGMVMRVKQNALSLVT